MTTLRKLDGDSEASKPPSSSLEEWYERIRDVELSKLTTDDLCRACRQSVFLDDIVPIVLERLAIEPLAGELYQGELASAVARLPMDFWRKNSRFADDAKRILTGVLSELDADVVEEVNAFFANLVALKNAQSE